MCFNYCNYFCSTRGKDFTGNFLIDDEVLRSAGVADFKRYQVDPNIEPTPDFFVD